jgi:hypothetical protein
VATWARTRREARLVERAADPDERATTLLARLGCGRVPRHDVDAAATGVRSTLPPVVVDVGRAVEVIAAALAPRHADRAPALRPPETVLPPHLPPNLIFPLLTPPLLDGGGIERDRFGW